MMNKDELQTDIIEVTVKGTIKTEHLFNAESGILGVLTLKGGKGEGSFTGADDSLLAFNKTSVWKSNYELLQENEVIASAQPPKKLTRAFNLDFEGEIYTLAPGGSKRRSWTIKNNSDQAVCEFLPRGALKRGALIWIQSEIPLSLLVFGYCLVLKRWQEESAAAGA